MSSYGPTILVVAFALACLSAHRAMAQEACQDGHYREFDRWIGDWGLVNMQTTGRCSSGRPNSASKESNEEASSSQPVAGSRQQSPDLANCRSVSVTLHTLRVSSQ